jgi:uncharacterized Zn finger protein
MSDTTPKTEAAPQPPEMDVAGSCPACSGDVAVRFTGRRAMGLCRSCGYLSHTFVHRHAGQLVFEEIVRAAA